jgi:hypothetical protein
MLGRVKLQRVAIVQAKGALTGKDVPIYAAGFHRSAVVYLDDIWPWAARCGVVAKVELAGQALDARAAGSKWANFLDDGRKMETWQV